MAEPPAPLLVYVYRLVLGESGVVSLQLDFQGEPVSSVSYSVDMLDILYE